MTNSNVSHTLVLLVNLGTPHSPTFWGVVKFLREFLLDPRVVELPRLIWWVILHGIVLPFRSFRIAKLYRKIWTPEGSPLKVYTQRLAQGLQNYLVDQKIDKVLVRYAMTYGGSNVEAILKTIENIDINQLIVIPLFPQYSATTTAAVFDKLASYFKKQRYIPALNFVNEYTHETIYHQAIADSILQYWKQVGQTEYLLFSFHGIPVRYEKGGDPYPENCRKTAGAVAKFLNLSEDQWTIGFQSRFGFDEWVKPYSDERLMALANRGVRSMTVVSPSFSIDCLETLEELNIQHRQIFLKSGGKIFHYVPALNNSLAHINILASLIENNLKKN